MPQDGFVLALPISPRASPELGARMACVDVMANGVSAEASPP